MSGNTKTTDNNFQVTYENYNPDFRIVNAESLLTESGLRKIIYNIVFEYKAYTLDPTPLVSGRLGGMEFGNFLKFNTLPEGFKLEKKEFFGSTTYFRFDIPEWAFYGISIDFSGKDTQIDPIHFQTLQNDSDKLVKRVFDASFDQKLPPANNAPIAVKLLDNSLYNGKFNLNSQLKVWDQDSPNGLSGLSIEFGTAVGHVFSYEVGKLNINGAHQPTDSPNAYILCDIILDKKQYNNDVTLDFTNLFNNKAYGKDYQRNGVSISLKFYDEFGAETYKKLVVKPQNVTLK